jgi:hypothetical protein
MRLRLSGARLFVKLLTTGVISITAGIGFGLANPSVYFSAPYDNMVFAPGIHTVMLRSSTWELALPVIEKGSGQQLELRFDDLSGISHNYGYTMVHCDVSWQPSPLSQQEFLEGFGQGTIRESANSFNTTFDYMHYRLLFPEEDCVPVLSGNYALVVYESDDPEKIVLTRRFYVTEKTVQITGSVTQPPPGEFRDSGQQVDFTVDHPGLNIRDPVGEITAVIRQNGRDDNAIVSPKPTFIQSGKIIYSNPDGIIFPGGNEFRNFDFKSLKYLTENMATIAFRNPYYHIFLKQDKIRSNKPHFNKPDLNGSFLVSLEKADDKHLEADYGYVHFMLEDPLVATAGNIYVTGGFCDWNKGESNNMTYNSESGCYEVTLLLKQGFYDYCYEIVGPQGDQTDETAIEGNFYETANDYSVYIYYHDNLNRYDRLLGILPLTKH